MSYQFLYIKSSLIGCLRHDVTYVELYLFVDEGLAAPLSMAFQPL
jgi:hypothetical protein